MIAYPTVLPKAEIANVISTIMTNTYVSNAPAFAKDVWTISGYALEQTVGELPQTFGSCSSSGLTSLTNEEACKMLQAACDASDRPGAVQGLAVNWKQILSWALQLLAQLAAG